MSLMVLKGILLLFFNVTAQLELPPGLLSATCWVESNHKVNAVNVDDGGSSSYGACQIKLETAQMLGYTGAVKKLKDPAVNVYWAGRYLKYQLDRYDGDPRKAVAAYNAGTHRVNAKGQIKNRKYVEKVFKAWANYK